ncbi:MAG: cytochrome c family protein [Caulobacter sp.]|nr:cytochrome c family protein [Caulobacter sp.]
MRAALPASMIIAMTLLAACGQPQEPASAPAFDSAAAPAAGPATPDPETQALLASLPAPYNTADVENGQRKFALCRSCHTITDGGANMTGPNLHGVFGRKAGSVEDFRYSEPVKTAGFVWDADHLNNWLTDPRGFLPGNRMSFLGVKDPKDRIDLIGYLMVETGHKPGG